MATQQINLDISLTAAERNAWQTLRPKVKAHLAKIFRVYRNLPVDKQRLLREHCPILDNILDLIGE